MRLLADARAGEPLGEGALEINPTPSSAQRATFARRSTERGAPCPRQASHPTRPTPNENCPIPCCGHQLSAVLPDDMVLNRASPATWSGGAFVVEAVPHHLALKTQAGMVALVHGLWMSSDTDNGISSWFRLSLAHVTLSDARKFSVDRWKRQTCTNPFPVYGKFMATTRFPSVQNGRRRRGRPANDHL